MSAPATIEKLVESLQTMQQITDIKIADPNRKVEHMRRGIKLLEAGRFMNTRVMVISKRVFAREPDLTDCNRYLIPESVIFIGSLASYRYLQHAESALDCMALEFTEPEVISADPEQAMDLSQYALQAAVLDIEACLSAEMPRA